MISHLLFFVSTIAWCQAMPIDLLRLYAFAVALTWLGKEILLR